MTARVAGLLAVAALAAPASAQIGVGVVLGAPTGLTAEVGAGPASLAVDIGITGDVFGQAHVLIRNSAFRGELADLRFLVGPGVFFDGDRPDPSAGVSVLVGLAVALPANLELFGQATPGIRLTRYEDFARVGAAVGLRYFP